jgi:hypothetical protein
MHLMTITTADFTDFNLIRSGKRLRCERKLKLVHMQLALMKLLFMDHTALGAFHRLLMSPYHLQWPVGSNIPRHPQ